MLTRFLCLAAILLAACTPARREVDADLVASVHFDGNGGPLSGHNDYQLRSQMEQGASSFGALVWPLLYFAEPVGLDRDALARDAYRLEVWYAHNGWFDARFHGWTLRQIRRRGTKRAAVVEIVGHVEAGEPSLFGEFAIDGLDRAAETFARNVRRTGYVQPGDQFVLESVYLTRDRFLQLLKEGTRAYATVAVDMTARPAEHTVDVQFTVDPGIVAYFGEIDVGGQETVSEEVIVQTLGFATGDPYDISKLARGQRRLFDLGVFSVVNLTPDLSDPTQERVPIEVRVLETKFQRLRLGGGGDYDGQSVTPRASLSYRHVNLFERLLRLDTGASAGLAIGLGQSTAIQPIFDLEGALSTPRLAGRPDWSLSLATSVRQDLQNGQFAYLNPQASLDLGYKPSEKVAIGFGPSWELYQFLQFDDEQQRFIARALFGADFKNPYQLFTLNGRLTVDRRDSPVMTRRGTFGRLSVSHALPVPAKNSAGEAVAGFHFTELAVDMRMYRTLRFSKRTKDFPWSWAGRLQGRAIQQWNDRAVPYPERVFMGGANDVRGFRGQQMGPYDVLCLYDADRVGSFSAVPGAGLALNRIELPRGGRLGASGTLEVRYDWAYDITWAVFSDMGFLVEDAGELAAFGEALRVSGGLGARYQSIIGPIRIDLAFRPLYPEDLNAPTFINCFAGDQVPRNFDLLSAWRKEDRSTPPVAVNLLLAIGEAL